MPIIGPKYDDNILRSSAKGKKSLKSLKLKLTYGRDYGEWLTYGKIIFYGP